jgi:antitoxin (DNA-binding transcriptional repressor) of toxin-antitoxin stability system
MREVGIRELKNRLSEYVRLVRNGEVLMVTDRGQVVAELRPPGWRGVEGMDSFPGLIEWARQGIATLGSANRADLYPDLEPGAEPGTAAQLLDEERGER